MIKCVHVVRPDRERFYVECDEGIDIQVEYLHLATNKLAGDLTLTVEDARKLHTVLGSLLEVA